MKSFFKISILNFVLFFVITSCNAQPLRPGETMPPKIKWMDFESAVALGEKQPKKLFIDVYTHWCGWCKKMDASTFLNDTVANYINTNFYAVKLDAETKDTLHFRGTQFVYVPEFKSNELAVSLLNKQMGYPSYVFLDEKFGMLKVVPGFLPTETMMPVLKFYAEDNYKVQSFEDFQKELTK
jgi:thioredoxin-related protein